MTAAAIYTRTASGQLVCTLCHGRDHTHAADCLAAGRKAGLKFDKPIRKGKWVTAVGRKPLA